MVNPSKKRKLPTPPAVDPASKRPKNSSNKPQPSNGARPLKGASKKTKAKATGASTRRTVDAAALAWKDVGEEFGGLQVIEGVDVVREGDKVLFVVSDDRRVDKEKAEEEAQDEDEPFEGFGDDPVESRDLGAGEADDPQDGVEGEGVEAEAKDQDDSEKKQQQQGRKQKENQGKAGKLGKQAEEELQQSAALQRSGKQKEKPGANSFGALAGMDGDIEGEEELIAEDEDFNVAAWRPLKLSEGMMGAIEGLKFARPTRIQERVIPRIAEGKDVIGKAQTGSGKTLAFGIPIVERWLEERQGAGEEKAKKDPMAFILSPTRELAKQLGDHLKALCDGLFGAAPYICVVTGGMSIQKQQRQLEKADIVIGTPGRLWEVLEGDVKLQESFTKIKFLVVDEADRLFKAGQFKEAENIIGALDRKDPDAGDDSSESSEDDADEEEQGGYKRQTLVFSATFDKDLQTKLAGRGKANAAGSDEEKMAYLMKCLKFRGTPEFIDVNPVTQMAEGLKEGLVECGAMEKDLFLYAMLALNPGRRTLVFTNSISAVRRLAPLLSNLNLTVHPLHSQMAQKARLRSLERFTASRNTILVATDVAARGLDIPDVDQVLHYHVPRSADTYIHRSGRTARGGKKGVSVLLCSPDEVIPTRRLGVKVHAKRESRGGKKVKIHMIESLPLDRKIASRLKPRVDLAKRIADATLAKEKANGDDAWMRAAAEDLGVEYDSEFEEAQAAAGGMLARGGRGGGRKRKEKEARGLSKAEMGALKAQLREEMGRRVNLGVSERYITGGRVDVGALLREKERVEKGGIGGLFLGGEGLGLNL